MWLGPLVPSGGGPGLDSPMTKQNAKQAPKRHPLLLCRSASGLVIFSPNIAVYDLYQDRIPRTASSSKKRGKMRMWGGHAHHGGLRGRGPHARQSTFHILCVIIRPPRHQPTSPQRNSTTLDAEDAGKSVRRH